MVRKLIGGGVDAEYGGFVVHVRNEQPYGKVVYVTKFERVRGLWWPPTAKAWAARLVDFVKRYLAEPNFIRYEPNGKVWWLDKNMAQALKPHERQRGGL